MTDKMNKEKEVFNTAYIDKELPTIEYSNKGMQSLTEGGEIFIKVSDIHIETAFIVFKKILATIGANSKDDNDDSRDDTK